MAEIVVGLLRRGIVVSLVTAAGYPGQPERYEQRLKGVCYILHFQLSFFFLKEEIDFGSYKRSS